MITKKKKKKKKKLPADWGGGGGGTCPPPPPRSYATGYDYTRWTMRTMPYNFKWNSTLLIHISFYTNWQISLFYNYREFVCKNRWSPFPIIPGGPPKKPRNSRFSGLCSDQQLSFFTLLDRASFHHYNTTKIIKFGWELFILWVISYGLSFLGFARFPEFRGTINDSFGRP